MQALNVDASADTALYELLRNSSLDCDERAPIYPKRSDIANWDRTRKDLQVCRERGDTRRRAVIMKKLSQLIVDERRQEFFAAADKLRAHGKSSAVLVEPLTKPLVRKSMWAKGASQAATLATLATKPDSCSSEDTILYVDTLRAFRQSPSVCVAQLMLLSSLGRQ